VITSIISPHTPHFGQVKIVPGVTSPHIAKVTTQFFYLAVQRSVWRDIKFAVFFLFFFVCTVESISTQDGAIGVKFLLRVEQTLGTGTR